MFTVLQKASVIAETYKAMAILEHHIYALNLKIKKVNVRMEKA